VRLILFILLSLACICEAALARIEITKVSDPTFGFVLAGAPGRHFILDTNSMIGGSHAGQYLSGAMSGSLHIKAVGQRRTSIHIAATGLSASGGVTSTTVLCRYDLLPEAPCNNGGISVSTKPNASLALGLDILTNTTHNGGDVGTISFDIEITHL
jgi:hypothetical protein